MWRDAMRTHQIQTCQITNSSNERTRQMNEVVKWMNLSNERTCRALNSSNFEGVKRTSPNLTNPPPLWTNRTSSTSSFFPWVRSLTSLFIRQVVIQWLVVQRVHLFDEFSYLLHDSYITFYCTNINILRSQVELCLIDHENYMKSIGMVINSDKTEQIVFSKDQITNSLEMGSNQARKWRR